MPAIAPAKFPVTNELSMLIFRSLYFSWIQNTLLLRAFQIAQRVTVISSKEGEIRSRDRAEKYAPPFLSSCFKKGRGPL